MFSAADDAVMRYVPDYTVSLIAPGDMPEDEIEEFQLSLQEVLLYIKYSDDEEKLQEVTQKNKNFRRLERAAAEVINVMTNSKLQYENGKGRLYGLRKYKNQIKEDKEIAKELQDRNKSNTRTDTQNQ